jgi:hypothetical protein
MAMDLEDSFHCQLGHTIQAWLWVEGELYGLYSLLMRGASQHLISVTFNSIQSVDAKLYLLGSCLSLVFPKESSEWKRWKEIIGKAEKLNKKRNKVVHEPAIVSVNKRRKTIAIAPSHFNALALVKGQTINKGTVINETYRPINAKVLADHEIDIAGLYALERAFKEFSTEIVKFRKEIEPLVIAALAASKKRRSL